MPGRGRDTAPRRELLDRVLAAVRAIGARSAVDDVLTQVAHDVVEVLGFRAAAVNVRGPGDVVEVRAVSGPEGTKTLLHSSATVAEWQALFELCAPMGDLLFADHLLADHPAGRAVSEWSEESPVEPPDGSWHAGDTLLAPLRNDDQGLVGVLSADLEVGAAMEPDRLVALELFAAQAARAIVDAQARSRLESLRRAAERRWRLVWENGLVASAVLDEDGCLVDMNDAAERLLGWPRDELVGQHFSVTVPEEFAGPAVTAFDALRSSDQPQIQERLLQTRDGRRAWAALYAAVVDADAERPVVVVQWIDITARKRAEERIVHQLRHDVLTDLPNRRALEEELATLFAENASFGVVYCDVDGFKSVADGLGHQAGDEMLVAVAGRLRGALPDDAFFARLDGDEFVAVLPALHDLPEAVAAAERLNGALTAPFAVAGHKHGVRMSVGVSCSRAWHQHPIDVLREADQAMLRAKRRGRSRVEVFDPGQDVSVTLGDLELEHALRRAVEERRELEPFYQSVISLTTGQTVGYEALLRWRRPGHGVLPPHRFLPIAERAGLAAALGRQVLELVARGVPSRPAGPDQPWIAVNVSAAQLGRGELIDHLRRLLDRGFADRPGGLRIEITESSLLDASPAMVDELYAVVDLGVGIALDDFGTGYSSLTLLRDLPVSTIKIDRSFIAPIGVDIRARTIVQHIIALCGGLGITTVAEGIETHEQLGWLRTLGCEFGQGYLIDRPSPWPFAAPGG